MGKQREEAVMGLPGCSGEAGGLEGGGGVGALGLRLTSFQAMSADCR